MLDPVRREFCGTPVSVNLGRCCVLGLTFAGQAVFEIVRKLHGCASQILFTVKGKGDVRRGGCCVR